MDSRGRSWEGRNWNGGNMAILTNAPRGSVQEAIVVQEEVKKQRMVFNEPWVEIEITKAVSDNVLSQATVDAMKPEDVKNAAMEYCVTHEWYWDWPIPVRQMTAVKWLESHKQTRVAFYNHLLDNKIEPYMSINAFMGNQYVAVNPSSGDSRTDYLYDFEYPWAGYVWDWWNRYGNNKERFGTIRVDSLALRFSHITPNLAVKLEQKSNEWEETKPYVYGSAAAIMGVAIMIGGAQLITAIKK